MKQNVIIFCSVFIGIFRFVNAQQISNFDTNRTVYMVVSEHQGVFYNTDQVELGKDIRLSLCRIEFYFEQNGVLQMTINMEDSTGEHKVRRYGIHLEPTTPFPLNKGTLRYDLDNNNFRSVYTVDQILFNGTTIDSYKGDLVREQSDSYGQAIIQTDAYLNIQKYDFKYFERNQSGVLEEKNSYTCETPPMS